MDVGLDAFLRGLFAASVYRGRTRFLTASGILDAALAQTVEGLEKYAKREHVKLTFKLQADALSKPGSNLSLAMKDLEADGTLIMDKDRTQCTVRWTPDAALAYLSDAELPIGFLDHGAKLLRGRYETARVRHSLHGLATRNAERRSRTD